MMIASIEVLNPQAIAQMRSKTQGFLDQIVQDPSLLRKAATDPIGTLQFFGFVANASPSEESHLNDDLGHEHRCCSDTTCIVSLCPSSCYVTIP